MSQTLELDLDQKGGVPIQSSGMTAISGAVRRVSLAALSMVSSRDKSVDTVASEWFHACHMKIVSYKVLILSCSCHSRRSILIMATSADIDSSIAALHHARLNIRHLVLTNKR